MAQTVKNLPAVRETWVPSLGREDSPGGGHSDQVQYSGLENPTDTGAWRATIHTAWSHKVSDTIEQLTLS